jgi:hypothetical protein
MPNSGVQRYHIKLDGDSNPSAKLDVTVSTWRLFVVIIQQVAIILRAATISLSSAADFATATTTVLIVRQTAVFFVAAVFAATLLDKMLQIIRQRKFVWHERTRSTEAFHNTQKITDTASVKSLTQ